MHGIQERLPAFEQVPALITSNKSTNNSAEFSLLCAELVSIQRNLSNYNILLKSLFTVCINWDNLCENALVIKWIQDRFVDSLMVFFSKQIRTLRGLTV